ncbi:Tyrosine kinase family catalytic domain protein [Ceratobasidium sp. AG-Ba]|nr:Tyrosine kinase family catalytic domain protein [Ceratobasidium sp. AG-Ba]QRW09024.1 Tyrosine kinase family catalytic domain protein [Ceratobasidium sp. AG-Ba]
MVSPWMEHGNLVEYIREYPGVDRYELCAQVTRGVSYLHMIQLVHGDLKACNLLVSSEGTVKISDFDRSILSGCSLGFTEATNTGGGTLRWMAPELLLYQEDDTVPSKTTESDVYALGMTMLEIITGRVPYAEFRFDPAVIRALDRNQLPKRPQELSTQDAQDTWMWSLLVLCWDIDPKKRPRASLVHNLVDGLYTSRVTEDFLFALQESGELSRWPEATALWV